MGLRGYLGSFGQSHRTHPPDYRPRNAGNLARRNGVRAPLSNQQCESQSERQDAELNGRQDARPFFVAKSEAPDKVAE
jgi:hypothetical protein